MSTLLERGLAFVTDKVPACAGGTIKYTRGIDSVVLAATYGRSQFESDGGNGVIVTHSDRDFIVAVSALTLGGVLATPQKGDRITDVSTGVVYEVLAPLGVQVFQRDPTDTILRVHTKKVST